ncbi:MAG: peptidoglycan DD-metalloendopeptidase family protein [Endomicrobium sp.]|jgi:septal ring factor EnvC (AmiA/AmiB activator)|nr:peptidoglycan DD-metalloendopeptidase family protein [Endomicrobium sp.]
MKIYNFLKIFITASFILNISVYIGYAETPKAKRLSDIKQSIREKQIEKDKLVLQEKIYQKELKIINETIGETENKLEKVSKDIESALKNINKSVKDYNSASLRKSNWNKTILEELNLFHKMTFLKSYTKDPMEYKLRLKSLEYGKNNFEKEKKSIESLVYNLQKLEKSKQNLTKLRQREIEFVAQNKSLLEGKNKILKTTADKRRHAEKEIRALNDSAKALQALINKINSENAKKRETTMCQTTPQIKRKKSLTWPVAGNVISYFGKTKHPELDTYIINNGIKISTSDYAKVKSIDSGEIVFTGVFRSYGKVVIIDHKNATFFVYGFLNKIYVKEGQKVSKDEVIADIGRERDAVLYFEIRQNNIPDDPLLWLRSK